MPKLVERRFQRGIRTRTFERSGTLMNGIAENYTAGRPLWRDRLYTVIFESESRGGKAFDLLTFIAIIISVAAVIAESLPEIGAKYSRELHTIEWTFTILFSIEYILRLVAARSPLRYAGSFFGVVDLLSIIPMYLSLFMPASHFLIIIRVLRLLRVFRILQLAHYLDEAEFLLAAIRASRRKVIVFLCAVVTLVIAVGSLMYMIEGPRNGFTSIPDGIYWGIGVLTTVDSGHIYPHTAVGRFLASVMMILGYGIIAVPTGIVTVEMSSSARRHRRHACPSCELVGHERDALFCRRCGSPL